MVFREAGLALCGQLVDGRVFRSDEMFKVPHKGEYGWAYVRDPCLSPNEVQDNWYTWDGRHFVPSDCRNARVFFCIFPNYIKYGPYSS